MTVRNNGKSYQGLDDGGIRKRSFIFTVRPTVIVVESWPLNKGASEISQRLTRIINSCLETFNYYRSPAPDYILHDVLVRGETTFLTIIEIRFKQIL